MANEYKKWSERIGKTQYMKVSAYSPIGIGYTMSHRQLNRNANNEKVKFQACSIIGYTIYVTKTIKTQTIKTQSQRKQRNS